MNKTILLIGGIIVIIALVASFFLYADWSGDESEISNSNAVSGNNGQNQQGEQNQGESGTLKDLLTSGQPMRCEFTMPEAEGEISGEAFVANERMRGNFSMQVASDTLVSHVIVRDNTVYTWLDGSSSGYSFAMDEEQADAEAQGESNVNLDERISYDCDNWSVDQSQFELPSNVNFQAMMTGEAGIPSNANTDTTQGSQGSEGVDCSVCDQVPADYRESCLSSLGCS